MRDFEASGVLTTMPFARRQSSSLATRRSIVGARAEEKEMERRAHRKEEEKVATREAEKAPKKVKQALLHWP